MTAPAEKPFPVFLEPDVREVPRGVFEIVLDFHRLKLGRGTIWAGESFPFLKRLAQLKGPVVDIHGDQIGTLSKPARDVGPSRVLLEITLATPSLRDWWLSSTHRRCAFWGTLLETKPGRCGDRAVIKPTHLILYCEDKNGL